MKRLLAVGVLIGAVLGLWLAELEARAGGGHSFGRSSRSYSSSRSSSRSSSWGSSRSSSRSSSWGSGRSSSSSSWGSWGSSGSSSSSSWGSSRSYSSSRSSSRHNDLDVFWTVPSWWSFARMLSAFMIASGLIVWFFSRAFVQTSFCPYASEALASAAGDMAAAIGLIGAFMYPAPLVLIFGGLIWWPAFVQAWEALEEALREGARRGQREQKYRRTERRAEKGAARGQPQAPLSPPAQLREGFAKLRGVDPNFSRPLFMDFVGLLHTRVIQARATGETDPVRAYAGANLVSSWSQRPWNKTVDEVVLGAAGIERVKVPPEGQVTITVRLEASWLETDKDGSTQRIACEERWVLKRDRTVLSKGPRGTDRLGCPACGGSGDLTREGRCTYCDTVVVAGTFDWHLQHSDTLNKEPIDEDAAFGSPGEEVGTDEPTIVDPDMQKNERALAARHPDYTWDAFRLFAQDTFVAIQSAWSDGDLDRLRPLESHALWSTHRYWLERYRRAGLRNVLTDVRVESIERVRYELDPYFESVTVRIFARMVDTTQNERGQVISGDPDTARRFSEYWTFIAAIGTVPEGKASEQCPACGAPMTLAMAGRCEYCDALIVAGQFGWVLSRIDQDEAYLG